MAQNKERPTSQIGLDVVSGLEQTLEWMRTQFENFRSDVQIEKPVRIATAHTSNFIV